MFSCMFSKENSTKTVPIFGTSMNDVIGFNSFKSNVVKNYQPHEVNPTNVHPRYKVKNKIAEHRGCFYYLKGLQVDPITAISLWKTEDSYFKAMIQFCSQFPIGTPLFFIQLIKGEIKLPQQRIYNEVTHQINQVDYGYQIIIAFPGYNGNVKKIQRKLQKILSGKITQRLNQDIRCRMMCNGQIHNRIQSMNDVIDLMSGYVTSDLPGMPLQIHLNKGTKKYEDYWMFEMVYQLTTKYGETRFREIQNINDCYNQLNNMTKYINNNIKNVILMANDLQNFRDVFMRYLTLCQEHETDDYWPDNNLKLVMKSILNELMKIDRRIISNIQTVPGGTTGRGNGNFPSHSTRQPHDSQFYNNQESSNHANPYVSTKTNETTNRQKEHVPVELDSQKNIRPNDDSWEFNQSYNNQSKSLTLPATSAQRTNRQDGSYHASLNSQENIDRSYGNWRLSSIYNDSQISTFPSTYDRTTNQENVNPQPYDYRIYNNQKTENTVNSQIQLGFSTISDDIIHGQKGYPPAQLNPQQNIIQDYNPRQTHENQQKSSTFPSTYDRTTNRENVNPLSHLNPPNSDNPIYYNQKSEKDYPKQQISEFPTAEKSNSGRNDFSASSNPQRPSDGRSGISDVQTSQVRNPSKATDSPIVKKNEEKVGVKPEKQSILGDPRYKLERQKFNGTPSTLEIITKITTENLENKVPDTRKYGARGEKRISTNTKDSSDWKKHKDSNPPPLIEKHSKIINVIFLGESGAGKSTLISGLSNYFSYPEFDDAKNNKLDLCIPVEFIVYSKDRSSIKVTEGQMEKNENFNNIGQSVTQKPKLHSFEFGNNLVQVLDTPGLHDSRGMEQDNFNLELIRKEVEKLKEIHAVCIVLKSNESRLGPELELALKQLFSLFPRKIINTNIFFFFTFASGTFFGIGDITNPLKEFFKKNRIEFEMTPENSCAVDSDGFKYLITTKQGIIYSQNRKEDTFEYYWEETAKNVKTFFDEIQKITPVKTEEIILMNQAIKLAAKLENELSNNNQRIQSWLPKILKLFKHVYDKGLPLEAGALYQHLSTASTKPEPYKSESDLQKDMELLKKLI